MPTTKVHGSVVKLTPVAKVQLWLAEVVVICIAHQQLVQLLQHKTKLVIENWDWTPDSFNCNNNPPITIILQIK